MAENAGVIKAWCEKVAALGVDVLLDHDLVRKEDFERATEIVAEEILVRLSMGDYPPPGAGPSRTADVDR